MEMSDKLGHIFSEALSEVVATVSGVQLQEKSHDNDNSYDDMTGIMVLKGKENGILSVSAKISVARELCSKIIGISAAEVTDDDIADTMCELVNMTAGSAKLRLSDTDYFFTLTQPFVIKGNDVSIITKNITNILASTLSNDDISIKLKAIY